MKTVASIFMALSFSLHAEFRPWRNLEGSKSINGEYIKHDESFLTIKDALGNDIRIKLTNLYSDDVKYLPTAQLKRKDELAKKAAVPKEAARDSSSENVFSNIGLGDTHTQVSQKLKECPLLVCEVAASMQGRTGLNGIYHTKETIGGLPCYLYFDWDESQKLKELSLQTASSKVDLFDTKLKDTWSALAKLMSTLHGKPINEANYPTLAAMSDGVVLNTHLWKLKGGGSVLLGIGQNEAGFTVSAKFTTEKMGE